MINNYLFGESLSKSQKTFFNAITQALNITVGTVMSLWATREVLLYLGSEYNGLNGTISTFLSVLMILESGFTLATLVKLYKPYNDKDYSLINSYLSKTSFEFKKIGARMFFIGTILASIYAMSISSSIDYYIVFLLFLFSIFSTSFNFFFTYKHRLLFQVTQTEYLLNFMQMTFNIVANLGMIFLIRKTQDILVARGFVTIITICASAAIIILSKKIFPFAKYNIPKPDVTIEGTKDLLISRIVGVIYTTLSVFYISSFVGVAMTSVFVIYNHVVNIVSQYIRVVISAPQNALGLIINTDQSRLKDILAEYQYIVVILLSTLFSTTMPLIIPFVRLYTQGVNDVNYIQPLIGVLLILIAITELIHIPSGQCIELSGNFKVVKRIQSTTLIVLIVTSTIGALFWGIIGILVAKLITNVILASIEIIYTHTKIVFVSMKDFFVTYLPNFIISLFVTILGFHLLKDLELTIIQFIISCIIVLIFNILVIGILNRVLFPTKFKFLVVRLKHALSRNIN